MAASGRSSSVNQRDGRADRAPDVAVVHWGFEFVPVAVFSSRLIGATAIWLRRTMILLLVRVIVEYAFLNLTFGPNWVVGLIYCYDSEALAIVPGRFPTNDIYNNQNVAAFTS